MTGFFAAFVLVLWVVFWLIVVAVGAAILFLIVYLPFIAFIAWLRR